jgi:hypothetical protein
MMRADVGDEEMVQRAPCGDEDRQALIPEVHCPDSAPPYLVRWVNGHKSVFVPSSATIVEHRPAQRPAS